MKLDGLIIYLDIVLATKVTPFELVHGQEVVLHGEVNLVHIG